MSKFGRTTTFISAVGYSGTLAKEFIGAAMPAGLATLVSCFRVTSIVTSG